MKTKELREVLEKIAPLQLQESWDNSGMQIDHGAEETDRVLVALEITSEVIEEAILKQADMIVTHHPLMFTARRRVTDEDYEGRLICRLLREGLSLIASHTCLDQAPGGINDTAGFAQLCRIHAGEFFLHFGFNRLFHIIRQLGALNGEEFNTVVVERVMRS